jgi:hypothetical protein
MDISDLTNEIAHGRTLAETASFLCRDEDEVREKMKQLALVEHAGKRLRVRSLDVDRRHLEAISKVREANVRGDVRR